MWLLNCSSYCDTCLESHYFFQKKCPPVNSYRSSSSTDSRTESTFLYSLHPDWENNTIFNIRVSAEFVMSSCWIRAESLLLGLYYISYNSFIKTKILAKLYFLYFIDFLKAFDCVDHEIGLSKLNFYCIRGIALDWLLTYLTNRDQYPHMCKLCEL